MHIGLDLNIAKDSSHKLSKNLCGLNLPKSRSGKINQFKHYTTDAPV